MNTDVQFLSVNQKGHLYLIKEQLCGHKRMHTPKVHEYSLTFTNEFAPAAVTPFMCLLCANIQAGRLYSSKGKRPTLKSHARILLDSELSARGCIYSLSAERCEMWLCTPFSPPLCSLRKQPRSCPDLLQMATDIHMRLA